jgi:hypothetical protein
MSKGRYTAILIALVAVAVGSLSAAAAARLSPARLTPVSVQAPRHPSVAGNVAISFRPHDRLPSGGYYYAVVVLEDYLHYGYGLPSCAVSSDMHRTAYGHPHRGRALLLTLFPARSSGNRWCAGGTYLGAVYADPHRPPCSKAYPCYGSRACGGIPVCGVVIRPRQAYSYPGGLPRPLDRSTRIVGRFKVHF